MCLRNLAGAFVQQRLGGVKRGKVSFTPGDAGHERLVQYSVREALARLVDKPCGLRCHRSSPSARISCMSGDGSRYAPEGNGLAEITTPVSMRMAVVMWDRLPRSSQSSPGSL